MRRNRAHFERRAGQYGQRDAVVRFGRRRPARRHPVDVAERVRTPRRAELVPHVHLESAYSVALTGWKRAI